MMKNKNMIILIGLLFLWIMIVRLRNSISSSNTAKNPTANTQSNGTTESTANDTTTNVEKPTTQRVEVSKSLAKNTKTLYDNFDLSPYGRSYTS